MTIVYSLLQEQSKAYKYKSSSYRENRYKVVPTRVHAGTHDSRKTKPQTPTYSHKHLGLIQLDRLDERKKRESIVVLKHVRRNRVVDLSFT